MTVFKSVFLIGCVVGIVACGTKLPSGSYEVTYKDVTRDCNVDIDNEHPYIPDTIWQIKSYVRSDKAAVTVYQNGSTDIVDHGFLYLGHGNGFEGNGSGFLDFPPKNEPKCLEDQSRVYMQLIHPVPSKFKYKTIYSKGCLSIKDDHFSGNLFFRLLPCTSFDTSCLGITCNIERKLVGRLTK